MMLGVQRTGVTAAAGALQRAGIISYRRGNVAILDRRGLERRACECYGISKREFDRLLGTRRSALVQDMYEQFIHLGAVSQAMSDAGHS